MSKYLTQNTLTSVHLIWSSQVQHSECKTVDYLTIYYKINNSDNGTAGALCMVNNGS